MNPEEKAWDLLKQMNGQYITLTDWQKAGHYAKTDLKRKAYIVVREVINALNSDPYQKQYWYDVRDIIDTL
jgi:hypothetical protein